MDIVIFSVCLIFGLVFTLLAFRSWFFGILGSVFAMSLVADIFVNGISEVYGYNATSGSALSRSFGVDTVILIPMIFAVVCAIGFIKARR